MLHVNAYNLYNIRLMDEIGPFHHEPMQAIIFIKDLASGQPDELIN